MKNSTGGERRSPSHPLDDRDYDDLARFQHEAELIAMQGAIAGIKHGIYKFCGVVGVILIVIIPWFYVYFTQGGRNLYELSDSFMDEQASLFDWLSASNEWKEYRSNDAFPYGEKYFFYIEPGAKIEVAITEKILINIGATYVFVPKLDYRAVTAKNISGPAAIVGIKYGKFL